VASFSEIPSSVKPRLRRYRVARKIFSTSLRLWLFTSDLENRFSDDHSRDDHFVPSDTDSNEWRDQC